MIHFDSNPCCVSAHIQYWQTRSHFFQHWVQWLIDKNSALLNTLLIHKQLVERSLSFSTNILNGCFQVFPFLAFYCSLPKEMCSENKKEKACNDSIFALFYSATKNATWIEYNRIACRQTDIVNINQLGVNWRHLLMNDWIISNKWIIWRQCSIVNIENIRRKKNWTIFIWTFYMSNHKILLYLSDFRC